MTPTRSPRGLGRLVLPAALALLVPATVTAAQDVPPFGPRLSAPSLPDLCAQYDADRGSLERLHRYPFSAAGDDALQRLGEAWLARLDALPFEDLARSAQVDWLLLRDEVAFDLEQLAANRRRDAEVAPFVTFAGPLVGLLETRSDRRLPELTPGDGARAVAETLAAAGDALADLRLAWEARDEPGLETGPALPALTPGAARRVAGDVRRLRGALASWYGFGAEYDPLFTWWCEAPWDELRGDLDRYADFLEEEVGGIDTDDEDLLLGDPIGREALLAALRHERIAYTPEELLALAEVELAWCDDRRREAAAAMGLGDDWRAAQEAVRALHVEPGAQPALIVELADEATEWLVSRDLLFVPELAEASWRLGMMSPERQRFTPYFTGGEVVSISYPTAGMEHGDKLQSMRGNNRHFSRATVHHELVPGHHLQGYYAGRWATHRRMFRTPFLVEGWALYWELRLWDLGFPEGPEDELGMLFWRAHRAARILFSLNFHLGNWSPETCVDFLVENVGHDRRNATAEVRRSIQGGYGPLYQAAYLLGGMQLHALHRELVEGGDWSELDFHEALLRANSIPPDLIRADLSGTPLTRDLPIDWRFPNVGR